MAAIATRIIAGCTWRPSQISSAVTSSLASTAPAEAGRAMRHRRHAVEEMRGLARAGGDGRHAPARRSRPSGRATRDARRDEVRARGRGPPASSGATVTMPTSARCAAIPRRMSCPSTRRSCPSGIALPPPAGRPQARSRLRAVVIRVDEIAFEMRGQHASGAGRADDPRRARRRRASPPDPPASHATVVGQNAVTPYRGSARRSRRSRRRRRARRAPRRRARARR